MRICLVVLLLFASSLAGRGGGGRGHGGYSSSRASYPHSTGYSGTGSGGGSHSYPHSTGLSGNSNSYNSRNYNHQQQPSRYNQSPKTEVHHHYHYSPPQEIRYGSTYHPVYHGSPPVYVYEYRDSGSRFDNLLTGLALYNLGRMSADSHHNSYYDSNREYRGTPGEICKLGISKRNGEYEETRIDCKLISSFIWDTSAGGQETVASKSVSTTVTNTTTSGNSTVTTVTVTNETDALKSKGPSIAVTPGMTCYLIRIYSYSSTLKKNVECGLLQQYAQSSLRRNGSERLSLVTISLPLIFVLIFFSCREHFDGV